MREKKELCHVKRCLTACANSEDSGHPAHPRISLGPYRATYENWQADMSMLREQFSWPVLRQPAFWCKKVNYGYYMIIQNMCAYWSEHVRSAYHMDLPFLTSWLVQIIIYINPFPVFLVNGFTFTVLFCMKFHVSNQCRPWSDSKSALYAYAPKQVSGLKRLK